MGGSTLSATTPAATEAKHTFLKLQDAGSSRKLQFACTSLSWLVVFSHMQERKTEMLL